MRSRPDPRVVLRFGEHSMADPEHLATLKKGADDWNIWRQRCIYIKPDLSGANLSGWYLHETLFHGANVSGANLSEADFRKAHFDQADLRGANLDKAMFQGVIASDA